jgi:hypothetical protein
MNYAVRPFACDQYWPEAFFAIHASGVASSVRSTTHRFTIFVAGFVDGGTLPVPKWKLELAHVAPIVGERGTICVTGIKTAMVRCIIALESRE